MKLITAHKILIRASVAFGVVFTGWSIRSWHIHGEMSYGIIAFLTAASTAVLYVYLKNFVKKNA